MKAMRSNAQSVDSMETHWNQLYQSEEKLALFYDEPLLFEDTPSKGCASPPCSQASQDSIGCGPIPDLLDIDEFLNDIDKCEQIAQNDTSIGDIDQLNGGDREVAETLNEFLNDPQFGQELATLFGQNGEIQTVPAGITYANSQINSISTSQASPSICYQSNDASSAHPSPLLSETTNEINESDLLDEEDTEAMAIFEDALNKALSLGFSNTNQEDLQTAGGGEAFAMETGFSGQAHLHIQPITEIQQLSPEESRTPYSPSPSEMSSFSEDSSYSAEGVSVAPIRKRKIARDSDEEFVSRSKAPVPPVKRRRPSTDDEKKRNMNKDAALRYRLRKKDQLQELEAEEHILHQRKDDLQEKMNELLKQVKTIEELFTMAGRIGPNWRSGPQFKKFCTK